MPQIFSAHCTTLVLVPQSDCHTPEGRPRHSARLDCSPHPTQSRTCCEVFEIDQLFTFLLETSIKPRCYLFTWKNQGLQTFGPPPLPRPGHLAEQDWLKVASSSTIAKVFSETCLLLVERFLWTVLSAGTIWASNRQLQDEYVQDQLLKVSFVSSSALVIKDQPGARPMPGKS